MPFVEGAVREAIEAQLAEAIIGLDADVGAALFGRKPAKRPRGIQSYYTWYSTDGVVAAAVDGLTEGATGQGYHNRMPENYTLSKAEEDGEEVPVALELVNEFGRVQNLDVLNPNVCRNLLISGYCPVEIQIDKFPEKSALKIIHPKTVKEIVYGGDEYHGISFIIQVVDGKKVKILGKNLAWFVHHPIANDKTGTSIIRPVESLLAIKDVAVSNMGKIIDRYLAPLVIWKSQRSIGALKETVEQRDADEDIYLGNLTQEEMKDLAQIVEIKGEARFTEFIEYIDTLIFRGLYAPDQFYSRNATEASARVMQELTDRNIAAIQRNMKRGIEAGFYARLMEANGIDLVPRLEWGVEKTGFEDLDLQLLILEGMRLGYVTDTNLEILLKLAGIDLGKLGMFMPPEPLDQSRKEPDEDEPVEEPEEEPEEESARLEKIKKLREELENE